MTRVLGVTLLLVLVGSATGSRASAAQLVGLSISVTLDEKTYVLGEPMLAFVSVRNGGPSDILDLAPLDPTYRWLQLALVDLDTGKQVPFAGPNVDVLFQKGDPLPSGEEAILTTRLNLWFGNRSGEGFDLTRCLGNRLLPPGKYRLTVHFRPRLGSEGVIHSVPVDFRVDPMGVSGPEVARVREFVAACPDPHDRKLVNIYCLRSLKNFYGSRYFLLVYFNIGPAGTIPVDTLIGVLDKYDKNPVRRAFVFGFWGKLGREAPQEKVVKVRKFRTQETDEFSRRTLDYWNKRLAPSRGTH